MERAASRAGERAARGRRPAVGPGPDVVVHGVDRDLRPAACDAPRRSTRPSARAPRSRLAEPERARSRGRAAPTCARARRPRRRRRRSPARPRRARPRDRRRTRASPRSACSAMARSADGPSGSSCLARQLVLAERVLGRRRSPSRRVPARAGRREPRRCGMRRARDPVGRGAAPPPPGRRSASGAARSGTSRAPARARRGTGSTRSSSSAASSSASARSASSAAARQAGTARSGTPAPSRCRATSTDGAPAAGERRRRALVQALAARRHGVGVDRLLGQRVPPRVRRRGAADLDDQLRAERLLERELDDLLVGVGEPRAARRR